MTVSSRRLNRLPFLGSRLAGGIQPPDHKQDSLRSVIMETPIPDQLFIPLQQHQGSPAVPIVTPGDYVLKGQLLAKAADSLNLPIHASTSGFVVDLEERPYPDEFGSRRRAITIQADGLDQWAELTPNREWQSLAPSAIVDYLQKAGICGLGGAGFPTHRKLRSVDTVTLMIINAMECEPYITADQALLREYAEQVVTGALILQHASSAARCVIVTERDKDDAIAALKPAMIDTDLELIQLAPQYSLGSEKLLIEALTGSQVPMDKHPADLGILVFNTGTAKAVSDAVELGRPLISRVTTVCGDSLKTPKNFQVLLGTPASYLLSLCGVESSQLDTLISGGSMMGHSLSNPNVPVVKTTNCLIAGSGSEFTASQPARPCIHCDFCSTACPVSLMPQFLYQSLSAENFDLAGQQGLMDCIECGACSYVCPSKIPLVQYYRAGKFELQMQQRDQQLSSHRKARFEARKLRLKRDALQHRGSRRRSVARPENPDVNDSGLRMFSRETAKQEITDAVARVKARKAKGGNHKAGSTMINKDQK